MMKLEDMWRQSDKSYIHPTDMHDKHIINAIKKATAKYSSFFNVADYTHYTDAEWRCVLRLDPALEKLVVEGLRRNIIPVQHPKKSVFYDDTVAPLASCRAGCDISRCFDCGAYNIVVEYLSAPRHVIVRCEVCKATIQSARAVEDWNATYQHRHEYKSNALLRLRLRGR